MHSEHPSPESLNAYFDRELSPDERVRLGAHVDACPDCRTWLQAFESLAGLAPDLDPALPGEEYWADLPDRILARIVADPVPAAEVPVARGFWSRLWHPQGFWRYAVGATAGVAVAVGAWTVLMSPSTSTVPVPGRDDSPSAGTMPGPVTPTPVSNELVAHALETASVPPGMETEHAPMTPIGGPLFIPSHGRNPNAEPDVAETMSGPSISPGSFVRRSIITLGNEANVGTSLDIRSGEGGRSFSAAGAEIGTPVAESIPPLGPDYRRETEGVVGYGCGVDTLELAFTSALKAEEEGNYALAAMGYRAIRDASRPGLRLYHAADYRLNVLLWRERVQRAYASEQQRARVLYDLQAQMRQAIATWQRTQSVLDCQKAQCMTKVFLTLGPEVVNPEQLSGPQADLQVFQHCSD